MQEKRADGLNERGDFGLELKPELKSKLEMRPSWSKGQCRDALWDWTPDDPPSRVNPCPDP